MMSCTPRLSHVALASPLNPDRAGVFLQQDLKLTQQRATEQFALKGKINLSDYQVLLDAAARYKMIAATSAAELLWNK